MSDVAASWLVIWSAIGREAAGCGAVRHTVDVVRVVSSYMRSTLRRQRGLFARVQQAMWGAQAGSGSRLRRRHEAATPERGVRGVRSVISRVPENGGDSVYQASWWGSVACCRAGRHGQGERRRAVVRCESSAQWTMA